MDSQTEVRVRPTGVRIMSGVLWGTGVGYLGWLGGVEPSAITGAAPAVALVCLVAYIAFWRPGVLVREREVVLMNPFRDVVVPYGQLDAVSTRYNLTLHAGDREYRAWGSPAPGMFLSRPGAVDSGIAGAVAAQRDLPISRSSASLGSSSGTAALLVNQAWERYLDNPAMRADRADPPQVTLVLQSGLAWLLALTVVATGLGIILG